jgi:hypothetical protein
MTIIKKITTGVGKNVEKKKSLYTISMSVTMEISVEGTQKLN